MKLSEKEEWKRFKETTIKDIKIMKDQLEQAMKPVSPGEREKPENKHLHTLNEQIACPSCYPDIRKKVYDKEFKNADAQCVGCGLLAKKEEAGKEDWECPNCGSKTAEARD